jgi:hypothetical protein
VISIHTCVCVQGPNSYYHLGLLPPALEGASALPQAMVDRLVDEIHLKMGDIEQTRSAAAARETLTILSCFCGVSFLPALHGESRDLRWSVLTPLSRGVWQCGEGGADLRHSSRHGLAGAQGAGGAGKTR